MVEAKRSYFRVRQIHCDPIWIGEVRIRYVQVRCNVRGA